MKAIGNILSRKAHFFYAEIRIVGVRLKVALRLNTNNPRKHKYWYSPGDLKSPGELLTATPGKAETLS